ncbi:hypothetical protein CRG98_010325 [Punica granatum]|uniref:Uncharacterized protein n=1 Tax=Punica granatum TaxID=22663 RepID=A0A2I0KLF3_PUNGR|nr:hypothetical protein CRG98_010325 [Punica granatum]
MKSVSLFIADRNEEEAHWEHREPPSRHTAETHCRDPQPRPIALLKHRSIATLAMEEHHVWRRSLHRAKRERLWGDSGKDSTPATTSLSEVTDNLWVHRQPCRGSSGWRRAPAGPLLLQPT